MSEWCGNCWRMGWELNMSEKFWHILYIWKSKVYQLSRAAVTKIGQLKTIGMNCLMTLKTKDQNHGVSTATFPLKPVGASSSLVVVAAVSGISFLYIYTPLLSSCSILPSLFTLSFLWACQSLCPDPPFYKNSIPTGLDNDLSLI